MPVPTGAVTVTYQAPLRELRFVLHELIGDKRLSESARYPDYSVDFADSVLDAAGEFAQEVLAPINRVGDTKGVTWTPDGVVVTPEFKNAFAQFVAGGWTQLRGPQSFGGQGVPAVLGTAVEELWGSANLAFKLCPMLTQAAVEAIHRCGTEQQKQTYLHKLISGEWTGTMQLTESQAGSDLSAIRTRATREGDHYRIYGQKIFITWGDHDCVPNIIGLVLARVDGAPGGVKGISLFIVPKFLEGAEGKFDQRNDVRCVSIEHKLGIHASPTCVLSFGDSSGAVAYLVGEENRGLEYMFIMMNAARLSVGLEGYALSEASYQHALAYARTRIQGKPKNPQDGAKGALPIASHPDVKRMLLTMKATTDAERAVAIYAAMQFDLAHNETAPAVRANLMARGELLIPIVKAWCTELGVRLTSLGVQVHGGMGFIEETGAAQYFRDSRICPIYEGTTGIQAGDLAGRKVARDAGTAMFSLIEDMQAELKSLKSNDASVTAGTTIAIESIALLRSATEALLAAWRQDPDRALSVSVPYLMLSGFVIGGWLMAKSQHIAAAASSGDAEFYASKLQLTRFYLEHVMPECLSLAGVVKNGAGSVMEADPALL
jgi:acyl-CoA dehydrogenase